MRVAKGKSTTEQGRSNERERELRSLRQEVQSFQQIIQSQTSQLDENGQALRQKEMLT